MLPGFNVKQKTLVEIAYDKVTKSIENKQTYFTLQELYRWYIEQYTRTYKQTPLDCNLFNTMKVFKGLCANYTLTLLELATSLDKWFSTYTELGYAKPGYETLTISCLRQKWLTDALMHDQPADGAHRYIQKSGTDRGKTKLAEDDNDIVDGFTF